jgi:4-hydroxythreonine-4-phosphate dehydrogenase
MLSLGFGRVGSNYRGDEQYKREKRDMKLPIIGISMGDPAGVGPEIAVKALNRESINESCHPLIVGDAWTIEREMKRYSPGKTINVVRSVSECRFSSDRINVYDLDIPGCRDIPVGKISAVAGHVAFSAVEKVIELALQGAIDATVTGPIHKKAIHDAGHHFAGHTEIFAEYTGTDNYAMLLACDRLKIIHVTTHVSLRKALDLITPEKVYSSIKLLHGGLVKLGMDEPRIGVAGLNPHAGDEGLFGDEDVKSILPAVKRAVSEGYIVEGPVPPDTLFPKALGKYYDGCVAMYHDQGHIPFKMAGFAWDEKEQSMQSVIGVNITLGLPIIRTSVDHGTAFDIAGRGVASDAALGDAIEYAIRLYEN